MKPIKRFLAAALALVMGLSALAGCGGGSSSSSSAASSSGASSSASSSTSEVEAMDLTGVTDPYLATSGLAGYTIVARVGETDITAAELLYWINYGIELTLSQYNGYMTELPWDTDLGDGMTPLWPRRRGSPSPRRPWTSWRASVPRLSKPWATRSWRSAPSGIRCSPGICSLK